MPEILEKRFRRAKSGLMLAPAKTQAVVSFLTGAITFSDMLFPDVDFWNSGW
jgi:hypothetical protein